MGDRNEEKETKRFAKIGANRTSMEISDDGKFILVLADGKPMKVETEDGKVKSINTNGEMLLKQANERAYIFDHSWRQVREKFQEEEKARKIYKKIVNYAENHLDKWDSNLYIYAETHRQRPDRRRNCGIEWIKGKRRKIWEKIRRGEL